MPTSANLKSKPKSQPRDRHSRSRNTTPVSNTSHADAKVESARRTMERSASPYLHTALNHPSTMATKLSNSPLSDIFEANITSSASTIPSANALNAISDSIKSQLVAVVKLREEASDRMMRELSQRQKERVERDRIRNLEQAKRDAEERRQQMKKQSSTPKKRDREEDRLSVSQAAPSQDGRLSNREHSSPMSSIDSHAPSNPDVAMKDVDKPEVTDSEEEQRPPPSATVQHFQVFGDDPTKFPDPTRYEIPEVSDDMTEEEKKAVYSVAVYPSSDLHEMTAGIPPDRDFSSAKPSNQVNAQTFANFVEPYLRPMTMEDLAFLSERQDRVTIFEIPKRGTRHYKEIWAEEDGTMFQDQDTIKFATSEPRGSIDQMNDDVAESDEVSTGPSTARWLALARPVTRPMQEESQLNGLSTEMDIDGEQTSPDHKAESQPPASAFPESTWRNVPHAQPPDYGVLDNRILDELRYVGFLSPTETPNYVDVQDDEVTARLRYLQKELRRISLTNGARKARILEIANDRMATQEWQGISDDLDTQLNQAYLKRTRNIGKGKKQVKRPGGPGGGSHAVGIARPGGQGVGEPIRSLMERREQWNNLIGPVVNHGAVSIPVETSFDEENMERLLKLEQDGWVDDPDEV